MAMGPGTRYVMDAAEALTLYHGAVTLPASVDLTVNRPSPNGQTSGLAGLLMWAASAYAEGIPAWGTQVIYRDELLRQYVLDEPFASSSVATVVARNAGYPYELTGTDANTARVAAILDRCLVEGAPRGYVTMATAVGYDMLTADRGAFLEIIREANDPRAPVVGLGHLPVHQCFSTGNPLEPVYFWDRDNQPHKLAWWQVYHLLEMPVSHPMYYGLQASAATRFFNLATSYRNIEIFYDEKVGGRHSRAIHLISGVGRDDLDAAVELAKMTADARMYRRYMPPLILPTLDPKQGVEVATLDLASLPDGFDLAEHTKTYLMLLALALLTDYQELAPLPSGNIGTGAQSNTLDDKSKLKGAALWRKNITLMMRVTFPEVEFRFVEQDLDEEKIKAEGSKLRAESRQIRLASGEIDKATARRLAVADGDLTADDIDAMEAAELEVEVTPPTVDVTTDSDAPEDIVDGDATETDAGTKAFKERLNDAGREFDAAIAGVFDSRRMAAILRSATPAPAATKVMARRRTIERDANGRMTAIVEEP